MGGPVYKEPQGGDTQISLNQHMYAKAFQPQQLSKTAFTMAVFYTQTTLIILIMK